jgi:hypothetical protein
MTQTAGAEAIREQEAALASVRRTARAYKDLFATPDGQLVLEDMKKAYHYNSSSLVSMKDMGVDQHATLFREGERNALLRILAIIETPEAAYVASGE